MLRLSATQLTTFTECPRKWYYNYHLRRCRPSSSAMARGSCFHKIFELYYGDKMDHDEVVMAIMNDHPELAEHLAECMPAFHYWQSQNTTPNFVQIDGKDAIEQEFALQLEDDVLVRGKIDYIHQMGNRAYITDLKCTGMYLSPYYFSQFELGFQSMLYSYVGNNFFDEETYGFKIEGFMIDAIMMRKNSNVKCERSFYPLLPNLDEFIDEIYRTANFIKTHLPEGEGAFEHRWTSCTNKYGKCPYFDVCKAPKEIRDRLLNLEEFTDYVPIYSEGEESA
jgi:hypothetical protein